MTNRRRALRAGLGPATSAIVALVVDVGSAAPGAAGSCSSRASTIATRPRRSAAGRCTASRIADRARRASLWVHELIGAEVRDRAGVTHRPRRVRCEANPAHDLLVLDSGALVPMVFVVEQRARRRASSTCPTACSTSEAAVRIDVFTIFPEYLSGAARVSLSGGRARAGLLDVRVHDPRAFTTDVHRSVDDAPFGGGAGMVMMPEPLFAAVEAVAARPAAVPAVGRAGRRFDQALAPRARRRRRVLAAVRPLRGRRPAGRRPPAATASSRSATTCSPAARRPRWS